MIITFNQIAYFKPATTARRLKHYYYSEDCRPEVFLSYLRLINIVALLCPQVANLSLELYHCEVRELFFTHAQNPVIIKELWRFRRFFTPEECCRLLRSVVLEPGDEGNEHTADKKLVGKESWGKRLFCVARTTPGLKQRSQQVGVFSANSEPFFCESS